MVYRHEKEDGIDMLKFCLGHFASSSSEDDRDNEEL